jgi:hypothetical protein
MVAVAFDLCYKNIAEMKFKRKMSESDNTTLWDKSERDKKQ